MLKHESCVLRNIIFHIHFMSHLKNVKSRWSVHLKGYPQILVSLYAHSCMIVDPPGHGHGHYFQTWCPSVRHNNKKVLQRPENKIRITKDTRRENNDHLLAGAWWVTLESPDLFKIYLTDIGRYEFCYLWLACIELLFEAVLNSV